MLYNAQSLPLELTRPEVAKILIKGVKQLEKGSIL
ncbi:hypothetical protein [Bacillus sp. OTU530]|jgi:ATP sulfurylase